MCRKTGNSTMSSLCMFQNSPWISDSLDEFNWEQVKNFHRWKNKHFVIRYVGALQRSPLQTRQVDRQGSACWLWYQFHPPAASNAIFATEHGNSAFTQHCDMIRREKGLSQRRPTWTFSPGCLRRIFGANGTDVQELNVDLSNGINLLN